MHLELILVRQFGGLYAAAAATTAAGAGAGTGATAAAADTAVDSGVHRVHGFGKRAPKYNIIVLVVRRSLSVRGQQRTSGVARSRRAGRRYDARWHVSDPEKPTEIRIKL